MQSLGTVRSTSFRSTGPNLRFQWPPATGFIYSLRSKLPGIGRSGRDWLTASHCGTADGARFESTGWILAGVKFGCAAAANGKSFFFRLTLTGRPLLLSWKGYVRPLTHHRPQQSLAQIHFDDTAMPLAGLQGVTLWLQRRSCRPLEYPSPQINYVRGA
jgi:hypothetical protein